MIDFKVEGAIFDVDDTLLDNKCGVKYHVAGQGLHERSRLQALHTTGQRHGIASLTTFSVEDNLRAFMDAPVHTLDAAVWNALYMAGVADSEVMNPDHPLLREIVELKNELHKDILMNEGEEVPGATAFVQGLAAQGLGDRLAIASAAVRRDIGIFLGKTGLAPLFPANRIFSVESITHAKPHPEVFNLAFDSLNLPESSRSRVCAFEDDPRGIMAAKAAGLFTCAITTRYTKEALLALEVAPDLVADSYEEFSQLFGLITEQSVAPTPATVV